MNRWGVWAVPPKTGIYSDLEPRFQLQYGLPCAYDSKEEAEEWARQCNSDPDNKWTYSVRAIPEGYSHPT